METFHQVTLLHCSAEQGQVEIVQFLLGKQFQVDELCFRKGRDIKVTSLHLACYNGHLEVVKTLLDAGANVNLSGNPLMP